MDYEPFSLPGTGFHGELGSVVEPAEATELPPGTPMTWATGITMPSYDEYSPDYKQDMIKGWQREIQPYLDRRQVAWRTDHLHLPEQCRPAYVWNHPKAPGRWRHMGGVRELGTCDTGGLLARPDEAMVKRLATSGPDPKWDGWAAHYFQPNGQPDLCHYYCRRAYRQQHLGSMTGRDRTVSDTWTERLSAVEWGRTADGHPWHMPVTSNHILIAGITGAGKGSVIWSAVSGLADAVKWGVVRLHGIDPKRIELAMGRRVFSTYAGDPDGMLDILRDAVDELHYRTEAMSGRSRKFTPSKDMPLNVVIIDELGYLLRLLPDRAQRQEAQELLTTVLVLGRAVGICLIGALQDPRKEVLDSRDLWPTKVALRLTREMTDLVLGRGAWEAGAKCDQITPEYAGAAYVLDETAATAPQLVRAWWFSDGDVKKLERDLRRYVRSGMA